MKIPVATLSQSPGVDEPAIDSGQQWTTRHFVVLLAGSLLAAFPKIAFGAHTLFYRDFGAMWYPVYSYTRDSILRGEIPVWNPYVHCGVPFQAQMGQWYPPLLASMLLPMPWSLDALFLVHLFFGGLGMYWLARRLNLGSFGSSFAGMAFVFNGVVLSSLLWLSYISCLAWMPWVVGLVMTAWREGGKWVPCAAL